MSVRSERKRSVPNYLAADGNGTFVLTPWHFIVLIKYFLASIRSSEAGATQMSIYGTIFCAILLFVILGFLACESGHRQRLRNDKKYKEMDDHLKEYTKRPVNVNETH